MVHAAKCLNASCDSPVVIPWKEDCQLVRKPTPEVNGDKAVQNGNCENHNGIDEVNGKDHHNGLDEMLTDNSSDVVRCNECGTKYTDKHIEDFVKAMEFTELHLQNMKEASVACILFKMLLDSGALVKV